MTDNTKVKVKARTYGRVGYTIVDEGIHRTFAYGEEKNIELGELKKLQFVEGGDDILKNYLIIDDQDALYELNMVVEPEYFYSEEEVKKILEGTTEESINQLEDALNFAPDGVIDLIKSLAVNLEIPDARKRKMITEKTGLNINEAIKANHLYDDVIDEDEDGAKEKVERKSTPVAVQKTERKSNTPVVVSTKK